MKQAFGIALFLGFLLPLSAEASSPEPSARIAAGADHTCALTSSGNMKCWGHNYNGQLGNGSTTSSSTPVSVQGLSDAIAIAAGEAHTCALTSDGKVWCWGANYVGQLGNETEEISSPTVPVRGLSDAVAIAAGNWHTCALTSAGKVLCWGENDVGQLGNGTWGIGESSSTPVSVQGLSYAVAIAAGNWHTCAVTSDGNLSAVTDTAQAGVWCWGVNGAGELGNGTREDSSTPVSVQGLSDAVAIVAGGAEGGSHTCALTSDGKVWCWGDNSSGQLGNGTTNYSSTPVSVRGLSDAVAMAAGWEHTCALTTSGTVKCWGRNGTGQLGNGTREDSSTPVAVKLGPIQPPKPKLPPSLFVSVSFQDASGDGVLEAEEEGTLQVEVENQGRGEAYGLEVEVEEETGLSGLKVGKAKLRQLEPGQKQALSVSLSSSRSLPEGQASLLVKVKEGNGFDADPVRIKFSTRAFAYPELVVTDLGVDTAGGVIQLGQQVTVKAIVQNRGEGRAEAVQAKVFLNDSNLFLASRTDTFALGNLAPGEWKELEFGFFTNKRYAGPKVLPVSLKLSEKRGPFEKTYPLSLELEKSVPTIAEVEVRAKEREKPLLKEPPKLTSDADRIPDVEAEYRDTVHVVAIGISDYQSQDISGIPYAAHDAVMFARYLEKAGGVPKGRIEVLTNERATGNTIKGVLKDWLGRHVREDDTVIVYYAGHGAPDPGGKEEAYLVPYDGDPDLPSTMIAREEVAKILQSLPTKKVLVVLDSCFSGKGRSVIAKAGRPIVLSVESPLWLGVTVLAAASGNQISQDYEKGKHGLFTYFLLKGMQGKADANADGQVTLKELYAYVRQQVPKTGLSEIGEEQQPTLLPDDTALSRFQDFFLTKTR